MTSPKFAKDFFLSSGTADVPANASSVLVVTGVTDPLYAPIISIVPVSEFGNVNSHIRTDIQYSVPHGQWVFNIIQSINADSGRLDLNEIMHFHWKVIGLKHVEKTGADVTPQTEAG